MRFRLGFVASFFFARLVIAQPAPFAGAEEFRAEFRYTVDGGVQDEGTDVKYSLVAIGRGTLVQSPPGSTYRAETYSVSVQLSYVGRAVNQQNCGMSERLVNQGMPGTATVAECTPAELEINPDDYRFHLNCNTVAVVHSYEWVGDCGQKFQYPDSPITTWWWQIENAVIGQAFPETYPYESGARVLRLDASASGVLYPTFGPLFTAVGTGKSMQGDTVLTGTLTPTGASRRLVIDDSGDYQTWRPTALPGGMGPMLPLKARLVDRDGSAPNDVTIDDIVWTLEETSSEPGIALNYPASANDTELDLSLEPGSVPAEVLDRNQVLKRYALRSTEDMVLVAPSDWGGWSTLSVSAILSDGTILFGELESSGETEIRLPRRRPDSHIAQRWLEEMGVTGVDSEDKEDGLGDGLTLFEEYRGFFQQPFLDGDSVAHFSGAPGRRDLFVRDESLVAGGGCRRYAQAADVIVHCKLGADQLPTSKVINANYRDGAHAVSQHAVLIKAVENLPATGGVDSIAAVTMGGPSTPGGIDRIELNSSLLGDPEKTAHSVAHELGHATNLHHHGSGDVSVSWRVATDGGIEEISSAGTVPVSEIWSDNGPDISSWQQWVIHAQVFGLGNELRIDVGALGGQSSGDEHCLMNYGRVAYARGTQRYVIHHPGYPPPKFSFCVSKDGTTVNASTAMPWSRFGPATNGDDKPQIRIADPP